MENIPNLIQRIKLMCVFARGPERNAWSWASDFLFEFPKIFFVPGQRWGPKPGLRIYSENYYELQFTGAMDLDEFLNTQNSGPSRFYSTTCPELDFCETRSTSSYSIVWEPHGILGLSLRMDHMALQSFRDKCTRRWSHLARCLTLGTGRR